MVQHHVKKGKKNSSTTKETIQSEKKREEILKDLDRFAGSSEEEEEESDEDQIQHHSDDDDDDSSTWNDDGENVKSDKQSRGTPEEDETDASSSDEDEYGAIPRNGLTNTGAHDDDDNASSSDSEGEGRKRSMRRHDTNRTQKGQLGMAGAMSRILGFGTTTTTTASSGKQQTTSPKSASSASRPVVLSKTITPLQKLQKKDKMAGSSLRDKQRQRRELNLKAMHVPLSAATTRPLKSKRGEDSFDSIGMAMAKELELERMHRRVATRGVVALFNAIATHQQQRMEQAREASFKATSTTKKNEQVQNMSKHGFLDMLKKSSANKVDKKVENKAETSNSLSGKRSKDQSNDGNGSDNKGEKAKKSKTGGGWNALKDDFMMNSKLKDWDKELSDEEDDDDNSDGMDGGGLNESRDQDADALMEDDNWSD